MDMLTGKLVRVRFVRDRVVPQYIDPTDDSWLETAERLLELFRGREGRTRGELEEEQKDIIGDDPSQLVHQGLVKLLEDRCEFEVVSGKPPEEVREAAFLAATTARQARAFDRHALVEKVAAELNLSPTDMETSLFADLKSEQHLVRFKEISPAHLLDRYNLSLAQAVLLRATAVQVVVRGEPPRRFRQLLRQVKFHRLLCEATKLGRNGMRLTLDGPLSLFSATQKYGLQLALFLPAMLLCADFELTADLRWGPQRRAKKFVLTAKDGLRSQQTDAGMYVPPELGMFAELFRKRIADWELTDETEIFPLGDGWWVPDFRLVHRQTSQVVLLEVLGFWRKASVAAHLERLQEHAPQSFLLAVSDQLHIDDAELDSLPAGVHRFRNMPLPEEVARLAGDLRGDASAKRR